MNQDQKDGENQSSSKNDRIFYIIKRLRNLREQDCYNDEYLELKIELGALTPPDVYYISGSNNSIMAIKISTSTISLPSYNPNFNGCI